MADEGMDLDTQVFLIENVSIANLLVDEVMSDLNHLTQDQTHVKLLDHVYAAHDEQGVTIHAFQNLAATAVLLLAIERKKAK